MKVSLIFGIFIVSSIPIISCQQQKQPGSSTVSDTTTVICTQGEKASFSLVPIDSEPIVNTSDLPLTEQPYKFVKPNATKAFRFQIDVCIDENATPPSALVMEAKIEIISSGSPFTVVEKSTGLYEALFGDYSNLDLILVSFNDSEKPVSRIMVKGRTSSDQFGYVDVAWLYVNEDGVNEPNYPFVIQGQFSLGAAFGFDDKCHGDLVQSEFKANEAMFQIAACIVSRSGLTNYYRIVSLEITDDHSSLPITIRGKNKSFSDEELMPPTMDFLVRHHNFCDSFQINLPYAKYRIVSAGQGDTSCEVNLVSKKSTFEIKYDDEDSVIGSLDCNHFMDCDG